MAVRIHSLTTQGAEGDLDDLMVSVAVEGPVLYAENDDSQPVAVNSIEFVVDLKTATRLAHALLHGVTDAFNAAGE